MKNTKQVQKNLNWPTKDYTPAIPATGDKKGKDADVLVLTGEVNGMVKGTKVQVEQVQFNGAVFICNILTGPKHGGTVRVRACDVTK